MFSEDSAPPPLPPHGITANSINVEYRPPVPPHRNIGVTANINGQQQPLPLQGGQRVCKKMPMIRPRRKCFLLIVRIRTFEILNYFIYETSFFENILKFFLYVCLRFKIYQSKLSSESSKGHNSTHVNAFPSN